MQAKGEKKNAVCTDHKDKKSNAGSIKIDFVPFIPLAKKCQRLRLLWKQIHYLVSSSCFSVPR